MKGEPNVADIAGAGQSRSIHPVHAVLLAGTIPLFLGAFLSDLAYGSGYQIQWKNFASWLIAGGTAFGVMALLCAIVDSLRADIRSDRMRWLYPLLLLATCILGFINALVHARDAWGSMPAGAVMSFIVVALAIASTWAGFTVPRVSK